MTQSSASGVPKLSSLKYQVTSVLGSGPGGTVMLIADRSAGGGRHALRIVKREHDVDDLEIERARAEFEASEKVSHAAILKCYDFRLRRSWFQVSRAELLMEYVDGKGLDTFKRLDIEPGVALFTRVAGAIAHLHRRGAMHGDLRPAHIMLTRTGVVKVRRYGLSLIQDKFRAAIKLTGVYAAPELAKEKTFTAQSDLYSLGATMYHALTGRPPAGGIMGRAEGAKLSTPAALNPHIPPALNRLIIECLQTGPTKRPPDMYEAVKQLEELSRDLAVADDTLVGLAADAGAEEQT
jgi:serine/threonine-protein kinase